MRRSFFGGVVLGAVVGVATLASAQTTPQPQPLPKKLAPLPGKSTPLNLRPPAKPTEPIVVYTVRPENIIFPSLLISSAAMEAIRTMPNDENQLGEPGGYIGIGVQVPTPNTPISVTITCDDLLEPSTFKGTVAKANMTYAVFPKIKWKFRELAKCRQPMPANITFKVKLGSQEETEHVETCTVRTINDCPLAFVHETGRLISMHFMAAAYVNENHPWVDGLLKDALDTKVVTAFTGYQTKNPDEVLRQVYAIWRVLKARGVSYSDISAPVITNDKVSSQTIRFLDECVNNKQANCIDGTVMIASVLRKLQINTMIVCIPGHAFLAIDLDPEGNETIGLETTIIGSPRKDPCERLAKLRGQIATMPNYDAVSWGNFEAAVEVGTRRYTKELPKLIAGTDFSYHLISIAAARNLGVQPIPYSELVGPTPAKPKEPTAAPQSPPLQLKRVR